MQNQKQPQVTTTPVVNTLRAARLQKQAALLLAAHVAAKQTKFAAVTQAYLQNQAALQKQQSYLAEIAQIQAKYGITLQASAAPRANSATPAPSASAVCVNGTYYNPCKAVHALAAIHGTRKATIAAAVALGINHATASTQYGIYKSKQPK
jgi:hypothetical protein